MREHNYLEAGIWHMPRHGGVGSNHGTPETFILALDSQVASAIPQPFIEGRRGVSAQLSYKELSDLMVIDCVSVGGIAYMQITVLRNQPCIYIFYFCIDCTPRCFCRQTKFQERKSSCTIIYHGIYCLVIENVFYFIA
jgi:hypothetical protein